MTQDAIRPSGLSVRLANLRDPADAQAYRQQLDAYANDPMGAAERLPAECLQRAVRDLAGLPHARVFLATQATQCVGFATCFSAYSTFRAQPLWNIHDIAVNAEHRGMGIGRALLGHIAVAARAEGCCKLTLEVREDNPVAESLYRAVGFRAAQLDHREVQYLFLEKPLETAGG